MPGFKEMLAGEALAGESGRIWIIAHLPFCESKRRLIEWLGMDADFGMFTPSQFAST